MPDTEPGTAAELTTEYDWSEWSDIELTNGNRVRVRVAAGQIELEVTDPAGTTATATLHSAAATGVRAGLDDAIADAFAAEHAAAFPPVTMTRLFSDTSDPTANFADMGRILAGKPWYTPDPDTPACGAKTPVPPESGYTSRFFVCDRPAGHTEPRHRQVTDALAGSAIEWKE